MGELSPWHWAIVIGIAVLLFGAKRLPDAARSLGRSARILKAELRADAPAPEPAAPAAEPIAAEPIAAEPPAAVTPPPTVSAVATDERATATSSPPAQG